MSWHYQIRQRTLEDKTIWYDIVEVYTGELGNTIEGMKPEGESVEEVIHVLEMMLADAKKYTPLIDIEENNVDIKTTTKSDR